ncbi:MAG TPA: hypothetical protein VL025_21865 [Thermoanaerobaculia bacterium]|nr:hypothetical protein [Thermoanaerobaculia bacterium]
MKSLIVKSAIVFAVSLGLWGASPRAAVAANCQCYYASDCPADNFCDWTASCTRHCELLETWKPEWGQPPTSKADCDKYTGPCHDNEPVPKNGDDGDGENCEPPSAPKPGGGTVGFKVRDGNCKKNPTPTPVEPAQRQVQNAAKTLVTLADSGGGPVSVLSTNAYINTVMLNVADLSLGQYDFSLSQGEGEPTWMADMRGTCGSIALQTLSDALSAEMDDALLKRLTTAARGAMADWMTGKSRKHGADGIGEDVSVGRSVLERMPADCQTWVQTRPHDCQFPHPEEHHHPFDYTDGLECIAHQLSRMADSMNLVP